MENGKSLGTTGSKAFSAKFPMPEIKTNTSFNTTRMLPQLRWLTVFQAENKVQTAKHNRHSRVRSIDPIPE